MHLPRFSFLMLAYGCSVVFAVVAGGETFAAAKKQKGPAPALVVTAPPMPNPEQGQKSASRKKSRTSPAVPERRSEVVQTQAQQAPTESKLLSSKRHRRVKVNKKIAPQAVVQPRADLMYHGLLENTQRYDPRPNSRIAGVPNPQTPDLAHDHFQELDRNQDGKIDPVERAFGRLDMDRDLHNRQP